jgi:hypothetical protein
MRILIVALAALAACGSSNTARGARQGAAWGAGAGAAGGAMAGADMDRRERERKQREAEAELAKLRREIGDDCYKGLEALTDCNHAVALAYADTAAKSKNPDHALAALWLRVLTYAEKGDGTNARKLFPDLVRRDREILSWADAEKVTRESLDIIRDVREEYGLPRECRG